MTTRKELLKKHSQFFKARGYVETRSYPLTPQVGSQRNLAVFTPAGIHPLIPYFSGAKKLKNGKLFNVQKSFRPGDMKEVGDSYHHSYFQQMGVFSFGNASKKEFIKDILDFLTKTLNIPIKRLSVSIFKGDKLMDRDYESIDTCISYGIAKERISLSESFFLGPLWNKGTYGPNNEFHYWKPNSNPPKIFDPNDNRWLEIGGFASSEYLDKKDNKGKLKHLESIKIDFGFGLERLLATSNKLTDNYLSNAFVPIISRIEKIANQKYGVEKVKTKSIRIIADHIRAATFIISEGILPDSMRKEYIARRVKRKPADEQFDKYIGREYLLRLLIRRAIRHGKVLGIENFTDKIAAIVLETYNDLIELKNKKIFILKVLKKEEEDFLLTLADGLNFFKEASHKNHLISGENAYQLYNKYGFPVELIEEEAERSRIKFVRGDFEKAFRKHTKK